MSCYVDASLNEMKYNLSKPREISRLISECRIKTDALLEEGIIGASVLEDISSLVLRVRCSAKFGELIDNLKSIKDDEDGCLRTYLSDICYNLKVIRTYLLGVHQQHLGTEFVDNHAFITHVVSVMVRLAIQSCDLWFSRKNSNLARVKALRIEYLRHQIDPTNPEFIKLILEYQEYFYNKLLETGYEIDEVMSCFLKYILNYYNIYTGKLLMSLVTHYFKLRRHHHEDLNCLFSEVEVLLAQAAILHRVSHKSLFFLVEIRKLVVEILLKELQISTINTSLLFSDSQIEEILKDLRRATCYQCRCVEATGGEKNSVFPQELEDEVLSLCESVQSKKMKDCKTKQLLLQLVLKMVFFKIESFLSEFSSSRIGEYLMDNGKEQIESLIMQLRYLKQVVSNQPVTNLQDKELHIFMQIEDVARRVSLLSHSFIAGCACQKFQNTLLPLPDLLNKVKAIKAKLEEISVPIPSSSFPKTFEMGFIDLLDRNIREVLKYDHPESIRFVNHLLEKAPIYLAEFKSNFARASGSDIQNSDLKGTCTRFMELAYKLECVVDSIEVHGCLEHSLRLYDVLEDMRLVNEQISDVSETSNAAELNVPSASQVSCKRMPKDTTPVISLMNVDLVDEEKKIINLLMRGSSGRDVVSIVGMPGIGKTTLAGKVCNDKNVTCHFSRRAWCKVSQVYTIRDLLLHLLSGFHESSGKFQDLNDDDLLSKLRRCLLGNRYLIVLDDMWDTAAWDGIQISFPDDCNGSRILITSRHRDVHSAINPHSAPHLIRSFSDDESWMLLEKKVFEGGDCPSELVLVGKKIAEHCQGLPLAVVAVAGLLQKAEKSRDWWEKISDSISSQVMTDPSKENRCKEILELSYKHLPEYLKPCFLYMGVFLRDKEIQVSKLMQFWLAEGFLQDDESKSLEAVAHNYLMELINRSLVIISKTRADGEVKTCRLHDLFRDLCHSKARDDNFLHLVTKDDEPYASFPDSDYDMKYSRNTSDPVAFESYRLSIFLGRNHFIDSKPSGPRTRSLIFFASADKEPRCPYEISVILNNFKLLRILHMECINMEGSFPAEIGRMIQLRYLALSGYMQSIPPSIANLWKLQILVVRGFRGIVILPSTIWGMVNLRHLHVNEHVSFDLEADEEGENGESSACLESLVSFSTPSLSCGDKTIDMLRRFPNLLKLKCIFLESKESSKSCNEFPALDFLSQLESLKIMYRGRAVNSGEFILPLSLKSLTLSNFRLPWKHISKIGELPNLKVLKLLSGAFSGLIWEMKEDEFKELEFLKLEDLNVAEWIATEDHLPNLKRLVVQNCKDLEEIPQDFACISTLEVIEVQWCTKSLEESAEKIGDLTEGINVVIAYN